MTPRSAGARIASIQIGRPRLLGRADSDAFAERRWTTGIFKEPVSGPVQVTASGIIGDGQADPVNHGGSDKAICAYVLEHYAEWRQRPALSGMGPGGFGENLTIEGLTEATVCIGDVWAVGDMQVQVSQPRQPSWKLARRWGIRDFPDQVVRSGRTGWYFRVLRPGTVEAAATPLVLIDRPADRWTIDAANLVLHGHPRDNAAAAELARVDALSASWRTMLSKR